ncbi:hypothetical protein KAR91_55905 [Candidatus Pacearchaeota archaeon]|nr:hypothetical protein [Candidatus Pacearchaeota archaeon]
MAELSHSLKKDITVGTQQFYDFAATLEAVRWWMNTPRWSKINKPDFGHQFEKYQNEIPTDGMFQDIQIDVILGVEHDLGLKVVSAYCWASQEDALCNVAIYVSDGTETGLVTEQVKAV